MTRRSLRCERIENRMREPFRISGYLFESMPSVVVSIDDSRAQGRAEAAGAYYLKDDVPHMQAGIEQVREAIEQGADRAALQTLLPAGGARNAIDCALWELESHATSTPVWQLAGASASNALTTTFTLSADSPERILASLQKFPAPRALKLKLDGNLDADIERVRTVRRARPDTWIGVDANQGYDGGSIDRLIAALVETKVSLLEQPNRRGDEAMLDGLDSPIPLAADESILDGNELEQHHHRYDVINIKLDKCGGLTEALRMKDMVRKMGKTLMVGNMAGGSLATAPAFVLGQFCDIVDLDGPWYLTDDPVADQLYHDGQITMPAGFWGAA
ncbi:dipeptide epimerase [Stakelama sp. CBK3Z-3]|uniref:Dipeptide epimerase n=1 Tax=Stakelama flava TaxID=2860338 RepID=A0ABS6XPV7_9SPHN|nr:dipeptide epimerase [Stakelama flava]MBW4332151.1 dipeptide epimerase [Stakelama flava]